MEMCSNEEEARDSGHTSEQESMCRESLSSGGGRSSSGLSTDVSDTRRVKYTRVREGRDNQESFHRA